MRTVGFATVLVYGLTIVQAGAQAPRVTSMSPAPGASLATAPTSITVTFDQPISTTTLNANTFRLVGSGGDGVFGNGNDVVIAAATSPSLVSPTTASFDLSSVTLLADTYQVSLRDSGAGHALQFGAPGQYVEVDPVIFTGIERGLTVELWFKPTIDFNGSTSRQQIINHDVAFQFYYYQGELVGVVYGPTHDVNFVRATASFTSGTWVHAALTWDGTDRRIFINGSEAVAKTGPAWIDNRPGTTYIGMSAFYPPFAVLDEVQVWSDARTSAGIQQDMFRAPTGHEPELVAYWSLDEGSGQTAYDRSARSQDGTLGSTPGSDTEDPTWIRSSVWPGIENLSGDALDGEFTTGTFPSGDGVAGGDFVTTFALAIPNVHGIGPRVTAVSPPPAAVLSAVPSSITITLDEPASASTVNAHTFVLEGIGSGARIAAASTPSLTSPNVATFDLTGLDLPRDTYVATLRATGSGSALECREPARFVTVQSPSFPGTDSEFTVEMWFNPLIGFHNATRRQPFVSTGGGAPMQFYYQEGELVGQVWDQGNNVQYVRASLRFPSATWTHTALTWDGAFRRLFVNGVEVASEVGPAATQGNLTALTIGFMPWDISYQVLDEVRIWSVARTGSEIQGDMNHPLTGGEPGLVGYWDFNEGAGQVAYDRSPQNNHGMLGTSPSPDVSDPTWIASTLWPGVQDLDGNALDGEWLTASLPSGDGTPGGDFVTSFTLDVPLIVTSLDDPGASGDLLITLREAIDMANATGGNVEIFFAPGLAGGTIRPQTPLPALTAGGITIDANIDWDSLPDIELDGTDLGVGTTNDGLRLVSANNVVKGLAINRFAGVGVAVEGAGATSNAVRRCFIGTDLLGTTARPNGSGVRISDAATSNAIGPANLISGNTGDGVLITGGGVSRNRVVGNLIGTDLIGNTSLANRRHGVAIWNGATDNTVGGLNVVERNVLSGNGGSDVYSAGVAINSAHQNQVLGNLIGTNWTGLSRLGNHKNGLYVGNGATGNMIGPDNVISGNGTGVGPGGVGAGIYLHQCSSNRVVGNLLGTNVNGTAAIANTVWGVLLHVNCANNIVGGTAPGERNVISGNTGDGVHIAEQSHDNSIVGNFIGTDIGGGAPLGNLVHGVVIKSGSDDNQVGGGNAGEGNSIAHNGGVGVLVERSDSLRNTIRRNSITANGGLGIALSGGGNANIAAPIIETVGASNVTGPVSAPDGSIVEVFHDFDHEGKTFLGEAVVSGGRFNCSIVNPNQNWITATVTDTSGNTSEFASAPFETDPPKVQDLAPAPDTMVGSAPVEIVTTFTESMAAGSVDGSTFRLARSGGDGVFGNGNDVAIAPISAPGLVSATSARFGLIGLSLSDDLYRVWLSGTGITDSQGNVLDGEYLGSLPSGDGTAGGDFVAVFLLDGTPPVAGLSAPWDNHIEDRDSRPKYVLIGIPLPTFGIRIDDNGSLASGVDQATVTSATIAISKDGVPLACGVDYAFQYDPGTKLITLSSLAGQFADGSYEIRVSDGALAKIHDRAGNDIVDPVFIIVIDTTLEPTAVRPKAWLLYR